MTKTLLVFTGVAAAVLINIYSFKVINKKYPKLKDIFRISKETNYLLSLVFVPTVFLLTYNEYGLSFEMLRYSLLYLVLIAAAVIDIKSQIIPNSLILIGIFCGIITLLINSKSYFIYGILASVAVGGILALISVISKEGLGMGDAKLFLCITLFLGIKNTFEVFVLSTVIGGLFGILLLLFRKVNMKTRMPFAPMILLGTILSMIN